MDLHQTFDQLSLAEIDDYISRGQEEHLQLDFKIVKSASLASADDRRNLAKSISGFANSAGGIIIWGVSARQNDQGIDCAVAAVEIQDLKLFLSHLNEFTGQAASPIVDGIRHRMIARTAFTGFAASYVPESQSGPHMAKLTEDRYYKRSGAGFYKMEHFDLEDMFGRRQKPKLEIMLEPKDAKDGVEHYSILVQNTGRGVARHAGFLMSLNNADIKLVDGNELENLARINAGRAVIGWNHQLGVIHPNGIRTNLGTFQLARKEAEQNIRADLIIYCEGARTTNLVIEIQPPAFLSQ